MVFTDALLQATKRAADFGEAVVEIRELATVASLKLELTQLEMTQCSENSKTTVNVRNRCENSCCDVDGICC